MVGAYSGAILAAVNFLRIYFLEKVELSVAITVSVTLLITVILAKVVGGILPLLA